MSASVQRPARLPALANIRRWRPQLSTEALIALSVGFPVDSLTEEEIDIVIVCTPD